MYQVLVARYHSVDTPIVVHSSLFHGQRMIPSLDLTMTLTYCQSGKLLLFLTQFIHDKLYLVVTPKQDTWASLWQATSTLDDDVYALINAEETPPEMQSESMQGCCSESAIKTSHSGSQ